MTYLVSRIHSLIALIFAIIHVISLFFLKKKVYYSSRKDVEDMNKLVVTSSYMGSGSSAFTALLQEFQGFEAKYDSFEYVFLHCPNGLFDLEDKLLVGNNAIRSDEALHSFYHQMKLLYNKKYYWVGHYKDIISPDFMKYVDDFMSEVIQYKPDFFWHYMENTNFRMGVKLAIRKIIYFMTLRKVKLKKPLLYPEMWISYVNEEQFYHASKQFLANIFDCMGLQQKNIVLDQLLLPHNLHRIPRYFDENLATLVIDRDPRDVYLINKYIWKVKEETVPFPTEPKAFCAYYRGLRESEKNAEGKQIIRIHFEDLVYQYEDTLLKIMNFLDLQESDHIHPKKCFNPNISIENTQLFMTKPEYMKEVEIFKDELGEYLYDFPYERVPDSSKTF